MKVPPATLPPWRIFFPAAAIGGTLSLVLFSAGRSGLWLPPGGDLAGWHGHEMIFGHFFAAFAGVFLTALPRWTGCPPLLPATTLTLFGLWLAARIGIVFGPEIVASSLSTLFLAALGLVAGRRILAANDRRDMPILLVLAVAALGDGAFMIARPDIGVALGLAAAIMAATVMGGRVAPALTRHWTLSTSGRELMVSPPPALEWMVAVITPTAFAAWIVAPGASASIMVLAAAAVVHALRIPAWKGWTTLARPSILALHLGYGFLPLGFAFLAVGTACGEDRWIDAARHAWAIGVLGLMCFAVQASVIRRHVGRPLTVDRIADFTGLMFLGASLARIGWSSAPWPSLLFGVAVVAWLGGQVGVILALGR